MSWMKDLAIDVLNDEPKQPLMRATDWGLRRETETVSLGTRNFLLNEALIVYLRTSCLDIELIVLPSHEPLLEDLITRCQVAVRCHHPYAELVGLNRRSRECIRIHDIPIRKADVHFQTRTGERHAVSS